MPEIHMAAPLLYEHLRHHLPNGFRYGSHGNVKPLPGFVADYLEKFFAQELPRKQER